MFVTTSNNISHMKNKIKHLLFLTTLFLGINTIKAATITSTLAGGFWNAGGSWIGGVAPSTTDDVVIQAGATITIRANQTCTGINISGTLQIGNSVTNRTLTCNGNLTIQASGTFTANPSFAATHILNITGNISNRGTFTCAPTATSLCNVNFNSTTAGQTISGTGAVLKFSRITIATGSTTREVNFTASNMSVNTTNFLTITSGAVKFSNATAFTATPFTGASTIGNTLSSSLELNSANVNFTCGNNLTLGNFGSLKITNGTLTIGDAANERLILNGNSATSGLVTVNGGTLNVASRIVSTTGRGNVVVGGGNIVLNTVSSASAPLQLTIANSSLTMTAGTITLQQPGTGNTGILLTGVAANNVTGGTITIGNGSTPAASTFNISMGSSHLYDFRINSANATASIITSSIDVDNDVLIAAGTLRANALNINVGNNWTNTGGTFTPGTGTVIMDGASTTHTLGKSGGTETFNNLQFSTASSTKTLTSAISCTRDLTIDASVTFDVSPSNFGLTLSRNFVNNGTFTPQSGAVTFTGGTAQGISGSATTTFYDVVMTKTAGISVTQSSAVNLRNLMTMTSGTWNTGGMAFTLVSTSATNCGAIGKMVSGTSNFTGNVTIQRSLATEADGWRIIGAPISSPTQSISNWSDNFITSGFPNSDYPNFSFVSMYYYDESNAGPTLDDGFMPATDISNTTNNNKGWWAYLGPTPITIDVTGAINTFSYPVTLTYTPTGDASVDGWNLIYNPYPSPIDFMNTTGYTLSNTAQEIQVWNDASQSFETWDIGAGSNGRNVVPSTQAFYIHATGASPSITFNENIKSTNTTASFIRQAANSNETDILERAAKNQNFHLKVSGNDYSDYVNIIFNPTASTNFESGYDAHKLMGPNKKSACISAILNNENLSILYTPVVSSFSTPIKVRARYTGSYSISAESFNNFPEDACIMLEDKLLGVKHDLRSGAYTCEISETELDARFVLHVSNPIAASTASTASCNTEATGTATVKVISGGKAPYNYNWNNGLVENTITNVEPGDYTVKVTDASGCAKTTNVTVASTKCDQASKTTIVASAAVSQLQFINSSNVVSIIANYDSSKELYLTIYNALGEIVQNSTKYVVSNNQINISSSNLENGIYFINVIVDGKLETFKFVKS